MRFLSFALIIIILASVAVVFAEEDRSNEPNWCFSGQAWGDGRCNHPDPYIYDYNWRMGWWMAHCELGLIPSTACYNPGDYTFFGGDAEIDVSGYAIFSIGGSIGSNDIDINGNIDVISPPTFFLGDA
jgi:hypothetical protein